MTDGNNEPSAACSIPWYSRDQWVKLKAIAVDADELGDTYEEWEASAEARLQKIQAAGVDLVKVDVNVDELIEWCRGEGRPVDADARREFAVHKLRERSESETAQRVPAAIRVLRVVGALGLVLGLVITAATVTRMRGPTFLDRRGFLWKSADRARVLVGLPKGVGGGSGFGVPGPASVTYLMLWAVLATLIWCAAAILMANKGYLSITRRQLFLLVPKYAVALGVPLLLGYIGMWGILSLLILAVPVALLIVPVVLFIRWFRAI